MSSNTDTDTGMPAQGSKPSTDPRDLCANSHLQQLPVYLCQGLERHVSRQELEPLQRMRAALDEVQSLLARQPLSPACPGAEANCALNHSAHTGQHSLMRGIEVWQQRTAECLAQAQASGALASSLDTDQLAALFWAGCLGAMLEAQLTEDTQPLADFTHSFFTLIETRPQPRELYQYLV